MAGRIRNRGCVPYIETEGKFLKPLTAKSKKDSCFEGEISPFHKLYMHHTLASARRFAYFKNYPQLIPQDELDLVLTTCYDQSTELFPDKVDIYLQPETEDVTTWRRLRNTRDLTPDREAKAAELFDKSKEVDSEITATVSKKMGRSRVPYRYNFAHRLLIGGITEKKHPSTVKLMNSSHHSPQTNAGYSRQPSDGNFYQY